MDPYIAFKDGYESDDYFDAILDQPSPPPPDIEAIEVLIPDMPAPALFDTFDELKPF